MRAATPLNPIFNPLPATLTDRISLPGRDVAQLDSTLIRSDIGEGSEAFTTPEQAKSSRTFYSDTIPRRVYKRRRREADRHVCLLPDEDLNGKPDSDASTQPNQQKINASHQKANPQQAQAPGFISSVFTFIENHPNLPHILSYYTQFLLNLFIVFFMMYLVYSFWSTIRSDVDLRSREVATETLAEIAGCAREFRENRCERSMRVPAMEIMCNFWEKCVNQDPNKVARAMVSASTFAEILNNFVEPITAKTMVSWPFSFHWSCPLLPTAKKFACRLSPWFSSLAALPSPMEPWCSSGTRFPQIPRCP